MSSRKPRSPGVILRGRTLGPHRYDDEIKSDGGKKKLHRQVRRAERQQMRREENV